MSYKDKKFRIVGKPMPRHDAWEKVLGNTSYAGDHEIPGMLHVKALRSAHAAARLIAIDTSAAEALEGVEAVLTAKDVPHNETVTKFGQTHTVGGFEGLYRVLADKKVRFYGEAVAIVAAETPEICDEALKLIKVEYEKLEGVYDPAEALKPGAYLVGEDESNLVCQYKIRKGDVTDGFSRADVIVENTFTVPQVDHAYMETECGTAWMGEDGIITIRASTQVIEHFRGIAEVLGLPQNKVRVIAPMVGGGFGGKEDITVETYLALVVYKTGRPCSMVWTREESLICHGKRHAYKMHYKTGVTKDGKLVAQQVDILSDAGAYVYLSPWILLYSTVKAVGPYDVETVKVDSRTVLTNNTFASANRGFGGAQVCFGYERQMDEAARAIGMDPLEFRRRNYLHQGDAMATGRILENAVETEATGIKVMEMLGEKTVSDKPNIVIGQGMASSMMSYGRMTFLHDTSRSYVSIELDGSVVVRCGVQDIGCGQTSSLASIAAEVLGVDMEDVTVFFGDTSLTPLAGTTTATRMLYMSGNATLKAAKAIRDNLLDKASKHLAVPVAELDLVNHQLVVESAPERNMELEQLVKLCASDGVELFNLAQFNAPAREFMDFTSGQGQVFADFTFGSHAIEVAVDTDTGRAEILKYVACYDAGQAVNKLSAEGQIEGGAVYGLGYGAMEGIQYDRGKTLNPDFATYLIPTSMDVPEIETDMIESGGGLGPFGAKGLGEPSSVPSAPAFVNAVCDAIGKSINDLPATPEAILKALES
ncbi:xanthine dehydrogenase family protein molybdopterin-binding subunit [Desulforhopalus singaporensis]|uniref:CO or xanthine dehydrogenase, Mo-binding subunit n=1 Tax=Desulforhopalus singaporensis TaxID=91360 RepID=A0A1H0SKC6_9BACT|nr:xanthine dehydrogenase family protein molybdopterin-binding subunit [Desulforhopalus singaporensis]SDP42125.1 CO or xanthine dehydrogenase, Mo-binding subunit [Desulforhopalus singaporensis]